MALVKKTTMEDLKKKDEQKNEPEVTEKLETEFPLSGGETDEDFTNGLKSLLNNDEEKENDKEAKQG